MGTETQDRRYSKRSKFSWKWITLGLTLLICITSIAVLPRLKAQGWTVYNRENSGFASYAVGSLEIDSQGKVWVGTYGGVSVLDTNGNWTHHPLNYSFNVEPMVIDAQGRAWFATDAGGVGLFMLAADGELTQYTSENSGLVDDRVWSLAIDPEGRVWVGTFAGLCVLSPDGTCTIPDDPYSVVIKERISDLAFDPQGRVWVGTLDKGVCTLNQEDNWICYDETNSDLPSYDISMLEIDGQGRLWAGTDYSSYRPSSVNSLSVFDPTGQWKVINTDYEIKDLASDSQGKLWLATTMNGIGILKPDGQFINFHMKNSGLGDDDVRALAVDNQGHVWVGTSSGVYVLDQAAAVNPEVISGIAILATASSAVLILQIFIFAALYLSKERFLGSILEGRRNRLTPAGEPSPRHNRWNWLLFAIGFIGWYLVVGGLWLSSSDGTIYLESAMYTSMCILPLNFGALILFSVIRKTRYLSLGILAAMSVNLAITLVLGMSNSGICFVPFFVDVRWTP